MRNSNKITVSREKRDDMVSALKNYFSKERDEEIGDLAASLILAFIIEELAPEFYNQGVYDSYQYLQDMMEDLLSLQK
jgi:uncharacterized protein (DUF2164 family)